MISSMIPCLVPEDKKSTIFVSQAISASLVKKNISKRNILSKWHLYVFVLKPVIVIHDEFDYP